MSFILASGSKGRLDLLKSIGYYPDQVAPQDVDESVLSKELPRPYVRRVSRLKVEAAARAYPETIVLAADTVVVMGRRIFQKSPTAEEASQMIRSFSGRRLQLLTALQVFSQGSLKEKVVSTKVCFKTLSELEISSYLTTDEWKGVSGGLTIEGIGGAFIKSIQGSYSNVIGLPVYETKNLLESVGLYADWIKK